MSYGRTEENGKDHIIFLERGDDSLMAATSDEQSSSLVENILKESDENASRKAVSKKVGGAINAETGEVNWDCPCLANALLPPCGSYFKAAFGCFASSKSKPQGMECVEQFAAFRECLALHPDIYYKNQGSSINMKEDDLDDDIDDDNIDLK